MSIKRYLLISLLPVMLLGGCRDFYVDSSDDEGPFLGTVADPYQRISETIAHVTPGSDHNIKVRKGTTYRENIELPRGIDIYPWDDGLYPWGDERPAPRIIGSAGRPVVTGGGHNVIQGLIIEGGSQGIRIDPSPTLDELDSAYAYVWNNEIRDASSSQSAGHGIEVFVDISTVARSQLEGDTFVQLFIENNYIHDLDSGDGIHIELLGVDTGADGEQGVLLDVKHNVVTATGNGISLKAQGVDLMSPAVTMSGTIGDNLLVGNRDDGIAMNATHAARISPIIQYNTIARNGANGLSASATDSNVRASLIANIIADNDEFGYFEATRQTTVWSRNHNLFDDNTSGHYFDFDEGNVVNSETALNRISLPGGGSEAQSGNLAANPLWESGVFYWMGDALDGQPARYFLGQNGTTSPAVDAGDTDHLASRNLSGRTTSIDGIANDLPVRIDTGTADIGFHYSTAH